MTMSSATKGLPGFLRRSLRTYEQEDEDDEEEAVIENGEQETSVTTNDDQHKQVLPSNNAATTEAAADNDDNDRDISNSKVKWLNDTATTEATAHNDENVRKDGLSNSKVKSMNNTNNKNSTIDKHSTNNKRPDHQMQIKRQGSYKETQFQRAIRAEVVNMSDLKKLAWNGCPPEHRSQSWKIMLGYLPVNSKRRQLTLERKRLEYKDAISQHYDIDDNIRTLSEQETLRQVLVDVPRTAPDVPLFRNDRIRRSLSRLLYIWAMRHPASSYVQGINDLATPLIVVFLNDYICDNENIAFDYNNNNNNNGDNDKHLNTEENDTIDVLLEGTIMNNDDKDIITNEILEEVEADCYWCLTNLLAGIQDHYTSDQPGVQRMVLRLEELVNRIDIDLCNHLSEVGIEFMQFAFKWMNCLLLREFTLKCICRLWDTYLSEGTSQMSAGFEDFHVYVCAAFLCQFSNQLQEMEFDEMFAFMQHIPTVSWTDTDIEMLLSQAYVLSTLFKNSDAHLTSQRTNNTTNVEQS